MIGRGLLTRLTSFAAAAMPPIRQATGLAPDETVAYFRAKDYATQAHWDELWQQEHGRWFTVTKMLDGGLLEKVRASLDDVLAKGGTFEQWKAAIVPQLKAGGWYGKVEDAERTGVDHSVFIGEARLRTIYDTNLRTARAAGRWQRIQATKAYQPFLMYDAVHDNRTRPLHRLWGGLDDGKPIILPVDHPAWSVYFPPCGWGCRCGVIQLSLRDMQRRGLSVTTDAELVAKGWITKGGQIGGKRRAYRRTDGTIEKVPAGIDPGFAYNPGEHFFQALQPPAGGGPLFPAKILSASDAPDLPPPRVRPASVLIDPATSADDVARQFLSHFDGPTDGMTVLTKDVIGSPLVLGDEFFVRGAGSTRRGESKLTAKERARIVGVNLLAETLKDPDEIWWVWRTWTNKDGSEGRRLARRYLARFDVDGTIWNGFVVMEYATGGWRGLSAYPKDAVLGDAVRGGTLGYRRK